MISARGVGGHAVRQADFDINPREIVGLAGLLGSGRTTLLRMLFGAQPLERGEVRLAGERLEVHSPREAMAAGIAYVPEDRLNDAAFMQLDVRQNLGMTTARRYFQAGRFRHRAERDDAQALMASYLVKAASAQARFSTLSGGNQQKVILARWLRLSPKVLLLDEPTQGVDVGARLEIWELVRQVADRGAAVMVVCSDLDELVETCDRALVMHKGRIVAEIAGADLDAEAIERAVLTGGTTDGSR